MEDIALEQQLRPAPGVPVAVLRGQVETAQALHGAIVAAVMEHDSIRAVNFSTALSQVVDGIQSMTAAEDFRDMVREEVTEALERERVEAQ